MLNAYLLHQGFDPAQIRGLQHDLGRRAVLVAKAGLKLRRRTEAHLTALSGGREYLITRYGAELAGTSSQLNRLNATLDEIAKKVTSSMIGPDASPVASSAPLPRAAR